MQDKDGGKVAVSAAAELCGVALNKMAEEARSALLLNGAVLS